MIPKKFSISALPLPPSSLILTHNLTPDPNTGTLVSQFRKVLTTNPSIQRRARLLPFQSHFSYVSPFPVSFPYEIEPPVNAEPQTAEDKGAYIEAWLAEREAMTEVHSSPESSSLVTYRSDSRDQARELIGLSETGLRDCVPNLDVGDAFTLLGTPSLSLANEEADPEPSTLSSETSARQDLVDVLSGHSVLMSEEKNFAPWSLRYSGHQFGTWAGQLGDGRAISILVTPHPSDPQLTHELQMKGSGRTPFSRSADGLAVLRSSIREFLCSEAMHALSIPTTRSLSLVSLPDLPVQREHVETACVMTRVAPSFLRIGSFEALNGPANMSFFGGGQQKPHLDALRLLGEWVSGKVLKLDVKEGEAWGQKLIMEVAKRNARMVAGWQAYGFMHGVINTDNVSIMGLTMDYGPYAFMDVFDPFHICNHTDEGGRYAYRYQPNMIIYALRALLNALAPLIGAEVELGGKAVEAGWADDASAEKIDEWRKAGLSLVGDDLEREMQEVTSVEYGRLMRKRLALRRQDPTDESKIFRPLLTLMEQQKLDFHITFRLLTNFKPALLKDIGTPNESSDLQVFISDLLTHSVDEHMNHGAATKEWIDWLQKYTERVESEAGEWGGNVEVEREIAGKEANPRFVLRQWVLEEVIAKVEKDQTSGKRILAKVLHMACNPFEPWGAEADEEGEAELDAEEKEERRFCGVGEKKMLGFQCSCSS